jgi:phenylacetate-coenzyme A ligase PaaK-like adenylate-forming protein
MQLRRFRELAAFARERSPYYARIMREHGIDPRTARPEQFPVLTKRDVYRHFDDIVTDPRITREAVEAFALRSSNPSERFLDDFVVVHTSGSSGEMGYFVYDLDAWFCGISHVSRAAGLRLRQRLAFVGTTGGHYAGLSMISTARELPFLYRDVLILDANAEMGSIVRQLEEYQPTTLTGYPTVLARLAELQLEGSLNIRPSLVQLSGEALTEREESLLERAFPARIVNVYSTSEFLFLGVGRRDWGGMVLLEDELIFEPHDDHVCITGLFNRTMPLIRYRLDDVLSPRESLPSAPLRFRAIETLVGRKEHAPRFTNRHGREDVVHPLVFTELVVKHVARYQIHLRGKDRFELRVQLQASCSEQQREEALVSIRDRVDRILAQKEMDNVRYDVLEADDLWIDPQTGKFRLIVPEAA